MCVTCLCLLEEASVCVFWGWMGCVVYYFNWTFFFFFQTAALQKVKGGEEEERDDRERSLTD